MQDATRMLDEVIFHLKLERFEALPPLQMVAEKLKTPPKNVLRGGIGAVGLLATLILLLLAHDLVYLAISVIYPAFSTARATLNDNLLSKEGKLWLSYWGCFGILTVINFFFGFILHHIPFFGLIQCVFTIWLYNGKSRGAEFLNNSFLQPFMKKYGLNLKRPVTQEQQETMERKDQ